VISTSYLRTSMIWLASFPRSGNTFFRNVLYEVYGLSSSTYHKDPQRVHDPDFASAPVVKTHLLPVQLPESLQNKPSVYIVRDGRDSLVSIAHHRKDIVAPGTDFYNNVIEATLAQGGSFFGGWSENVNQWTAKADIIIRFEDLIKDPINELEKLRAIMDLPEPDLRKLPNFKTLKFGKPRYGGGQGQKFDTARAQKHFRRGKAGGWRDELPTELEKLVWRVHGPTLEKWGYEPSVFPIPKKPRRVLIEGSKLYSHDNDGIKRYLAELVQALSIVLPYYPEWEVSLYDNKSVQPLVMQQAPDESTDEEGFRQVSERERVVTDRRTMGYEKQLLLMKLLVKRALPGSIYEPIARRYREGRYRSYLNKMKLWVRRRLFARQKSEIEASVRTADLVHLPLPQHIIYMGQTEGKVLGTVHDLTHWLLPDLHTEANLALADRGMEGLIDQNAHFLVVSDATQKDMAEVYDISDEYLHRVYEAANTGLFAPRDREKGLGKLAKKFGIPPEPYLLCLSTIEPRKNLPRMLEAFIQLKEANRDLSVNLVVCGKHGWKTEGLFQGLDLNREDIIFTGFVDDAELPYLYAHAQALAYVSVYEGFGLPLVEAMACGTPVIYGSNSSMPEVVGEGGIGAEADSVPQIREAMYALLTNHTLWKTKSEAAYRQAQTFSWLKTAVLTLETYQRILDRPS
ncbi:MAG: glycosyltransferase, partial [Bacteroidota bacterium]